MKYPRDISLSFVVLTLVAACIPFGLAKGESAQGQKKEPLATVTIKQDRGKVVYWVLPGKRRLSPKVFGTPDRPKMLVKDKIQEAQKRADEKKGPPSVPELLTKMPFLVGLPMELREKGDDGYWYTKMPTLFSDKAIPLPKNQENYFRITYVDYVTKDQPGKPGNTPDNLSELECVFHDPKGNKYELKFDHIVQPPFPGYETEGGVMLNSRHHGSLGTGSPLMPEVYTYAAMWGICDVYINGKLEQPHRVFHIMTTEVVRDKEYKLALDEEMPLAPSKRHIASQEHHTHVVVLPIKPEEGKGPVFNPLRTAFMLPNGMPQPFIHVMFEQDEIVNWPFKSKPSASDMGSLPVKYITITATEFEFSPKKFSVRAGQKVVVSFKNEGVVSHEFHLRELDVRTEPIQAGEQVKYSFVAPKEAGTLHFECSVAGHTEAGMTGIVVVEKGDGLGFRSK